jgi:ABC-type transport system substrate-binding protein
MMVSRHHRPLCASQVKDPLTVALPAPLPTLDPHMHFDRVGASCHIHMFDPDNPRTPSSSSSPRSATSWKALSDTQWEFKLRKGVRFHNGDIMSAEGREDSFDRVLDQPKKSPRTAISGYQGGGVVNRRQFHIITGQALPASSRTVFLSHSYPRRHRVVETTPTGDRAGGDRAVEIRGSGSVTS